MKAIIQSRYGSPDALELRDDVAVPVVRDDEVLVRVYAASVHADVWHVVRGVPYVLRIMGAGVTRPKKQIPGTDVAGRVVSVGAHVTRFREGDEVFGETVKGYQWVNGGAFAEYVAVPEHALARKPQAVTFEEAAAVPTSGIIALHAVRDQGGVKAGDKVLVNGAAGGVGAFAVQLAKALGAEVTAVDHGDKLDHLRELGADHVVDFTREDFTKSDARYDAIIDIPGNHPFSACRRVLTASGRYVLIGHDQYGTRGARWLGSLPRFFKLMLLMPFSSQLPKLDFSMPDKKEAMDFLSGLLEMGKLTPHIDKSFTLAEVPAAIRHLEAGRAVGKVVISILP